MRRRAVAATIAGLLAGLPAAANAERVVDYAIGEDVAAQYAAEQGVPLTPMPARGTMHIALTISPQVDHDVLRVGIFCSGWKVNNPMSSLVKRMFDAWDRDGAPAASVGPGIDAVITVDRASTLSRCVATGELKTSCVTRVSVQGTVARIGGTPTPLRIEHEEVTKGIGACAGLTRGIGLVSRSAVALLVNGLASPPAEPATAMVN